MPDQEERNTLLNQELLIKDPTSKSSGTTKKRSIAQEEYIKQRSGKANRRTEQKSKY